jgi:hypothetical protein
MTPWARNIICNSQINFLANLAKAPTKLTNLQNKKNELKRKNGGNLVTILESKFL